MKHLINPQIDCVFKAILGSEENKPLLLHFLNGVLKPKVPIVQVELLNPYNEKEFLNDKLSIVDIKACDEQQHIFQIELQMTVFSYLPERMLYTWSDIYGVQLQSGQKYNDLRPVISIWLLAENLFKNNDVYHHLFQIADLEHKVVLSEHCEIHVLEINKWQLNPHLSAEDQWLYFFKEAKHWSELPKELNIPEMRQAMTTLQRFSKKEKAYHLYQAREDFIREEKTRQILLEAALQREKEERQLKEVALQREKEERQLKEQERQLKEQERQSKEVAIKEQQRLRDMLKKLGVDPDTDAP